jgi:hypothetical protein
MCTTCYEYSNNSRILNQLQTSFKPKSLYNEKLFNIFIVSINTTVISSSIIGALRRFKIYLEYNEIPEIKSWIDIYTLSEIAELRRSKTGRACPFIRLGHQMAKQELLPQKKSHYEYYLNLKSLGQHRNLVEEYLKQLKTKSFSNQLRRLRLISNYHLCCDLISEFHDPIKFFSEIKSRSASVAYQRQYWVVLNSFYSYLQATNKIAHNPFSELTIESKIDTCKSCKKTRAIVRRNLCHQCIDHQSAAPKISEIESKFSSATLYNDYLFKLYLKYIRRYHLNYDIVRQTQKLSEFLSKNSIAPIINWNQIHELKKQFPIRNVGPSGGYAVLKIARMLEELGVINHRELDFSVTNQNLMDDLPENLKPYLVQFINKQKDLQKTESTIRLYLINIRNLMQWRAAQNQKDLFTLSKLEAQNYVLTMNIDQRIVFRLRYFFGWAQHQRLIITNPFPAKLYSKNQNKIRIISPESTTQLIKFIKNINSDPEQAFLLSLIIFWGLDTKELTFSTIDDTEGALKINIFQKPFSYGRQHQRPSKQLQLPTEPEWFRKLQIRFLTKWREHYLKTTKTFPIKQLCLPYNFRYNRPLSTFHIRKRIYKATQAAIGEDIPIRILRQTCGALHVVGNDGFALTQLGWSQKTSFRYTWCDREYFTSENPK